MAQTGDKPTLLVFGQDFDGPYRPDSDGVYSKEVRRFFIKDNGSHLSIKVLDPEPKEQDERYRRRDLNVVPAIRLKDSEAVPYFVALSGVFTETGGAWTIPVVIDDSGHPSTFSPTDNEHV